MWKSIIGIKEEKINKHYYYSVLLTNLADNENKNINQYIYDYLEKANETWIPLKGSLLTNKNNLPIIDNGTLFALTLLIAESKPEEMEIMKQIVVSVLNKG